MIRSFFRNYHPFGYNYNYSPAVPASTIALKPATATEENLPEIHDVEKRGADAEAQYVIPSSSSVPRFYNAWNNLPLNNFYNRHPFYNLAGGYGFPYNRNFYDNYFGAPVVGH